MFIDYFASSQLIATFIYENIGILYLMMRFSLDYLLVFVAIACLGLSTYQTARGLEYAAGAPFLAWIYSIILSIILLAIDLSLKVRLDNRKLGFWILPFLLIYMPVASISMAANFNALFSNDIQKQFLYDEIESFQADFSTLKGEAQKAAILAFNTDSLEIEVGMLKSSLSLQILNPGNPGIGQKARKLIVELEETLGTEMTILDGSASELAEAMEKQIDNLLAEKVRVKQNRRKDFSENVLQKIERQIVSLESLKDSQDAEEVERGLESAVNEFNAVIGEVNSIGEGKGQPIQPLALQSKEIGKISHSLSVAPKPEYRQAAFVPFAIALGIDLLVPILVIIFAITDPERKRRIKSERKKRPRMPNRAHGADYDSWIDQLNK